MSHDFPESWRDLREAFLQFGDAAQVNAEALTQLGLALETVELQSELGIDFDFSRVDF